MRNINEKALTAHIGDDRVVYGSTGLRVYGSTGLRVYGSTGLRVYGSTGLRDKYTRLQQKYSSE